MISLITDGVKIYLKPIRSQCFYCSYCWASSTGDCWCYAEHCFLDSQTIRFWPQQFPRTGVGGGNEPFKA
jgi:hypothetical protein